MDKKIFRRVGTLIAVSLVALASLQAVWLVKMYRDMNRNFSRQVTAALEKAAYDELISRTNSSPTRGTSVVRTQHIINDSIPYIVDSVRFRSLAGRETTVGNLSTVEMDTSGLSRLRTLNDTDTTQVVINLNAGMPGQQAQNILVLNIPTYNSTPTAKNVMVCDSLLTQNLAQAGISQPFALSLKENETGNELFSSAEDIPGGLTFRLPADAQNMSYYFLSIANPNRAFLREMAGILISSLLIIALITFAFWYLLRTLFRQKSLEKMRLDLTHNITHELKTPIAVASAAGEALTDFGAHDDPEKRGRYLKIIGDQLGNLSGMVENILNLSLYEQSRPRFDFAPHCLRDMVIEQARALSLFDMDKAEVTIDIPGDLHVTCDKNHFSTVIKNLLDNAVKYSAGRAEIAVTAREENAGTFIKFSDRGIGIPKASQGRIFEKFYRVPTGDRHDVKGFGLGLHYVREMVERHGGKITVESRQGKGTTFTIILPGHEK